MSFSSISRNVAVIDPVHAAVEDVKQVMGKHPVDIRVPEDITVRLDADRIKEVLVQLLENAAKYSPPESPIRITAEMKKPVSNSVLLTRVPASMTWSKV